MTKFHYHEKYYPHLFGSEAEVIGKFIWGLGEGLRAKVMGTRPDSLADAINMTTDSRRILPAIERFIGKRK